MVLGQVHQVIEVEARSSCSGLLAVLLHVTLFLLFLVGKGLRLPEILIGRAAHLQKQREFSDGEAIARITNLYSASD